MGPERSKNTRSIPDKMLDSLSSDSVRCHETNIRNDRVQDDGNSSDDKDGIREKVDEV